MYKTFASETQLRPTKKVQVNGAGGEGNGREVKGNFTLQFC